jgi:hypothetical protein
MIEFTYAFNLIKIINKKLYSNFLHMILNAETLKFGKDTVEV